MCVVLCAALIGMRHFLVVEPVYAATQAEIDELTQKINDGKSKIEQLQKSIDEYNKKISEKRTEAQSLSNQLAILDNQIKQIELDIEVTEATLQKLQLEIEALAVGIVSKEEAIDKQQKMLAELVRTLHYENNKKYIEVMAAYDNFSDFYTRVQYLKSIEQDLGQSAKAIRIAKEELEQKKAETEERKKTYEQLKERLANRKSDLDEQSKFKGRLLAQTQSSEMTYKSMVANLKSQSKQVENEIVATEQAVRKKLAENKQFNALPDDETLLSWPTQSRYVTAYFHDKSYPFRYIYEHPAIDIRSAHGTPVAAVKSGYIARARTCTLASCYAYVMIAHDSGITTVYGHLSKISVKEDQFVTRGDIIGYSGATPGTVGAGPFTTGPHLHFEVRKNGIPVNPLDYLIKDWE
ncbi:MAG TPA: peptidoglycan DD-metalloendopeptidase family protein [Candidatus Magasanikbacteria bacterium]|nr:peptidoglycan DD-metalloendopeptidase family protein [Candidatus Magasanikbacteria bacterium]